MKNRLLLLVLLLAGTSSGAWAQSRPYLKKSAKGSSGASKGAPKPPPVYAPIVIQKAADREDGPPPVVVNKVKLKKPVLVYYEAPAPGKVVALLVGLDITPRTIDTLLREEFTSAAALSHATTEELKQLGIAAGQALLLKSKFDKSLWVWHGGRTCRGCCGE